MADGLQVISDTTEPFDSIATRITGWSAQVKQLAITESGVTLCLDAENQRMDKDEVRAIKKNIT